MIGYNFTICIFSINPSKKYEVLNSINEFEILIQKKYSE